MALRRTRLGTRRPLAPLAVVARKPIVLLFVFLPSSMTWFSTFRYLYTTNSLSKFAPLVKIHLILCKHTFQQRIYLYNVKISIFPTSCSLLMLFASWTSSCSFVTADSFLLQSIVYTLAYTDIDIQNNFIKVCIYVVLDYTHSYDCVAAFLLRATLLDSVLRAVSVAQRPVAPACKSD